jgi:DNA-binding CsgD family transcriptional regulator
MSRRTHLNQATLLALIDSTYAAAEDFGLWEPLLRSISDAVGGTSACLLSHDLVASGSVLIMSELHPDVIAQYNAHYHTVDAWALAPYAHWADGGYPTFADEEIVTRSELKKTEFYPYVRKYGISRMMHANVHTDGRRVAGLSVYRRENDPAFGEPETRFLKALAPHVGRALRLQDLFERAAHEREAALETLDRLPMGVLLVTGEGRVLHANGRARAILTSRDGLHVDHSALTASSPAATSSLRRSMASCVTTTNGEGVDAGGTILLSRPSGRRSLQVMVSPVKRVNPLGLGHEYAAAIIFIVDPEHEVVPDLEVLRSMYGLTRAEAGVALLLASGLSIAEISERCTYTVETVRWYSKQILGKTGCRNRAELVRELSALVTSAVLQQPR